MASVAGLFHKFFERNYAHAAQVQMRATDVYSRVPVFANEDIYFFVKRIDNTGVVRKDDPRARRTAWKLIGSSVTAAIALVAVLMPGAYNLLAGYQIQNLKQEAQRLAAEEASLELQEAQMLSPERMEKLARDQQFIDPPSQKVIYLDNRGGSLAMNQK